MSGADLSDALSDMWRSVLLFVPTALAFLAILLIGYVLARLLRAVAQRSLRKVGLDRAVQRSSMGRALRGMTPSDLCAKIVFYGVLLFALQLAFGLWGPNAVSELLSLVIAWLPRAFVAIVIVVVAAAIAVAARDLILGALGGLPYGPLLARGTSVFIIGLGLIAALEQVGIATAVTGPVLVAVLATIAGVIIVGVGGGLVRPMQQRWERWLDRAGAESQLIREHAVTYAQNRAAEAARVRAEEEARIAARLRAEAEAAEQARLAEEARAAEQARIAEQARLADEARIAEEARQAEEARVAEEARQAEESRVAEEERVAEQARPAGEARAAETDETREVGGVDEDTTRRLGVRTEPEAERTQVIPVRAPAVDPDRTDVVPDPDADGPDFVPGFDRPRAGEHQDSNRTQVLPPQPGRPRPSADEQTQVIDPRRPADG